MEFATTNLREKLLHELQEAKSVQIAVAYFSPEECVLAALQRVPRLRLLVANDFQVNNPDSLKSLSQRRHWVRAVSAEEHGGNLHSKVYLFRRRDNSLWAMVGSANLTRPGLDTNQEACIIFDSRQEEDETALCGIRAWLDELFSQRYPKIDFDLARAVFETRNNRNARRSASKRRGREATGYWAVKPGYCGEYWLHFLAEDVVAIGWEDMGDPSIMTHQQAIAAYRATWPDETERAVSGNVAQILRFSQAMSEGDLVLVCGRYDAIGNEDKDAYLYGIARTSAVDGQCYFYDVDSDWYGLKRHATIQRIEQPLPRSLIARALGIRAIVPTIQELDRNGFVRLEKLLRTELGIVVDV